MSKAKDFISCQRDSIIALEQDDVRKHDSDKCAKKL